MKELLNQIQVSESAIKIYLNSLGRTPLSSYELYSIVSNISADAFNSALNELIEVGLLIPIPPQKKGSLSQYLAIPPFNPITKYYANINANLDNIKKQLGLLLTNSLKKILSETRIIELESVFDKTRKVRNDYQEEILIQKQEIDDIVYGMENLKVVVNILENIKQTIKTINQSHFTSFIKMITNMKKEIMQKVELLDLKKNENQVKYIVEQVFKDQSDKIREDFIAELHQKIDKEFNNTLEALRNIINSTFRLRDDFKMLLLTMLNSFESNFNLIIEIVKQKKDGLAVDLKEFEKSIIENFDVIIKNSVDSVTALNHPIEKAMKNYFKTISSEISLQFDNLVNINSISRVNETIKSIIANSINEVLIVVPKLEDHLNVEDFKNTANTLKLKIVSSEAQTNSVVKKIKEIKNLEYRTLLNENVIILLNDNQKLLLGIIQKSSTNTLQDFIGFETSYIPLIKLLDSVIKTIWSTASPSLQETPRSIGISLPPSKEEIIQKEFKPVKAINSTLDDKNAKLIEEDKVKKSIKEEPMKLKSEILALKKGEKAEIIPDLAKELQYQINFTSKVISVPGSPDAIEIDTAFNILIQKLPNMKGEEFSKELDKIAEFILEKKGFSVTLHKIRSKINQYKTQISTLSELDIEHIKEGIKEWKAKLL